MNIPKAERSEVRTRSHPRLFLWLVFLKVVCLRPEKLARGWGVGQAKRRERPCGQYNANRGKAGCKTSGAQPPATTGRALGPILRQSKEKQRAQKRGH